MGKDNASSTLYSSTFVPLMRHKTLGIWFAHQVVIGLVCVFVLLVRIAFLHARFLSIWTVVLVAVLVADLWLVHGRLSVWQVLLLRLGLLLRTATGSSKATVSPITSGATVAFIDVPGADGETVRPYRVINSGHYDGACFIWDSAQNEATVPLLLYSDGSQLASNVEKNARAEAFSTLLNAMREFPDVTRINIQSRALVRPTDKGGMAVDGVPLPPEPGPAARDLDALERGSLAKSMHHDYVLTMTVNPSMDSGFAAGSGKAGRIIRSLASATSGEDRSTVDQVSAILAERVDYLSGLLGAAGVTSGGVKWLCADQLRGEMKLLNDPDATSLLRADGSLPDDIPVQTSWREFTSMMSVGSSWARTYWIDAWPERRPVGAGWLTDLVRSPDINLIFTQAFRRQSNPEAKKTLDNLENEIKLMDDLRAKAKMPQDYEAMQEHRAVRQLLDSNARDKGHFRFQGFITVLSSSREQLENDCNRVEALAAGDQIHLDKQANQQLARWVGALPLGLEGR
jgi:hypothetical protein